MARATIDKNAVELPLTQRAYTLRLRPATTKSDSRDEIRKKREALQDALWATHEAVNKGAKVFGDWLLTLRGGLDHTLADEKVVEGKGDKKRKRHPTEAERRNRRILLALSWLGVESAPKKNDHHERFVIATGEDQSKIGKQQRVTAVLRRLHKTLLGRLVPEQEIGDPEKPTDDQAGTWIGDCGPSLSANIREDAVWVDRWAMFDAEITDMTDGDRGRARTDAHMLLSFILGPELLMIPAPKSKTKSDESESVNDEGDDRQKAIKASSKGAGQRTRHPFSHLLGEGKPFGKPTRSLQMRQHWHELLKDRLLKETRISVAPIREKGKKKEGPAHTEIQREMFSKAASRIAQIVTKQRQQEADRQARRRADESLAGMEQEASYREAIHALDAYCRGYGLDTASTGEFRIRPRAIAGWDRIIKRWAAIREFDPEKAREARIEAVKEVEREDSDQKFGHADLFFRLADEECRAIWWHDKKANAEILKRYVEGWKARSDAERLKVAAFRHPDPYRNPIFCQFGVSRPAIHFRRLKQFTNDPLGNDHRAVGMLLWHPAAKCAKLTLMHGVSSRMDREIGSACEAVQVGTADLPEISRRGRLGAAAAAVPSVEAPARVAGVFDLKPVQSRGGNNDDDESPDKQAKLKEPKWNGTLSANRRELARIRSLLHKAEKSSDAAAKRDLIQRADRRRAQLRWVLTVSMEMEGRGPWFRHIADTPDKTAFLRTVRKDEEKGKQRRKGTEFTAWQGWPWEEINKPLKERSDGTSLVEDKKAARGDKARLILSRLPGLRVLSVDLGHRFAAACAVWEALSTDAMKKKVDTRTIRAGGMDKDDLYCHVETPTDKVIKTGRNKGKPVTRTTVYRRISADTLPDGKPHPAPWARLDRQFMIKLPGEDQSPRKASDEEMNAAIEFEKAIGRVRDDNDALRSGWTKGNGHPLPARIDKLMYETLRTARLAIRRHGDHSRIAYAMTADYKPMPGVRKLYFHEATGDNRPDDYDRNMTPHQRRSAQIDYIADALVLWHGLDTPTRGWRDQQAAALWNKHIQPILNELEIQLPEEPAEDVPDTAPQRKKRREMRKAELRRIAERLLDDQVTRKKLNTLWSQRWNEDTPHWRSQLKWLRRWLMPRGLRSLKTDDDATKERKVRRRRSARNVGSLSLTRIGNIRSLWQIQKAFYSRPEPDNPRAGIDRIEKDARHGRKFGDRTLQAMEKMREQRVKQLASRIAEAALGVGIERDRVWDEVKKKWRYPKRPREILYREGVEESERNDPRFKTCHSVVIENLTNYRPDELQTRRENRQLMAWSSSKVKKYLSESCQLHGLHLREVQAGYTSRQDSRTGAPGMRCQDILVEEFMIAPWWRRQVNRASENVKANKGDARDRYLHELDKNLVAVAAQNGSKSVRIPVNGGELFVSADSRSPSVKGLQADLNAAANVGLRALLDPDWSGKWWYVPCASATHEPHPDKVKGSDVFKASGPLVPLQDSNSSQNGSKPAKKQREIVNFWRDPSPEGPQTSQKWRGTAEYWNDVRCRVIRVLSDAQSDTNVPVESPATPW